MAEIEHDPDVTPAGEAIHMPEPSYLPAALAVSIAVTLVGILTWLPVLIIGAIVTIVLIVRWIREARAEMNELPLTHH
jgi:Flp pilus assembly protein TadB